MTAKGIQHSILTSSYIKKGNYKVIIASPVFGTGFSIDKGLITTTFGFMFQYPPNVFLISYLMC